MSMDWFASADTGWGRAKASMANRTITYTKLRIFLRKLAFIVSLSIT
jgi:hypothetical protein